MTLRPVGLKGFVATLLLALPLASLSVEASVVYSQLPGDGGDARVSDFGADNINQQADGFILAEDATIRRIWTWGVYSGGSSNTGLLPPPLDDFTLRFFADNGSSAPNATPFIDVSASSGSWRKDTGLKAGAGDDSRPVFQFNFVLDPGVMLTAGVTYYLSIFNNTLDENAWSWLEAGTPTAENTRYNRAGDVGDNHAWNADAFLVGDRAFELKTVQVRCSAPVLAGSGGPGVGSQARWPAYRLTLGPAAFVTGTGRLALAGTGPERAGPELKSRRNQSAGNWLAVRSVRAGHRQVFFFIPV